MKQYALNLIPRLKQFSESLDNKELFVEKPWVFIDENQNYQKYIFKKNGDLVMSLNGQVTIGKWEYLGSAKSLLIDRVQDKILLNQAFVDPAVMVLKRDGQIDGFFFLANEILMPDLNVSEYIKKAYHQKNNILSLPLKDGKVLEVIGYMGYLIDNEVSIEGQPIPDGMLEAETSDRKYLIKDGKLYRVFTMQTYPTNKGDIVVEIEMDDKIRKGNFAFHNGNAAPDGKYRLSFWYSIVIENGRVVKG
jgi:hypothetical protein